MLSAVAAAAASVATDDDHHGQFCLRLRAMLI